MAPKRADSGDSSSTSECNYSGGITKRKRACHWSDNVVKALLSIWEGSIDDLRRFKRNKHIYEQMSQALRHAGYLRTGTEIKIKLMNLSMEYRKERSKLRAGGVPQWKLYEDVNRILGRLPPKRSNLIEEERCSIKVDAEGENESRHSEDAPQFELIGVEPEINISFHEPFSSHAGAANADVNEEKVNRVKSKEQVLQEFFDKEDQRNDNFENFLRKSIEMQERSLQLQESLIDLLKQKL